MTRPWRAALALAVTACLTLTACGGGAGESAQQSGASQAGYPRTIQHAMGSTVLETQPKTVAALDTSYVDAALALETQVVAYTKYRNYDQLPDYLGDDRRFGAGAKVIGPLESPDVEQLYDIKPDVIVSAKVRHEKYYDQFTGVAPTVFSTTTGAMWKDNTRLLARVLGKESLAEQKIGAYEQRAQRIGQEIAAKLGRTPTVSIVRFVEGEPTVRLYSSTSYPGVVMADAKLSRPAGQPDAADKISVNLSQEDIAKLDADIIFVSSYSDETKTAEDPKAKFQANPLWATLKGKIVDVSDTTWFSAVSLQGASAMLTDLANQFGVTP
ncbi:iron-siderophore ABC transporter substrate-binding protein [Amycolatopsis granulosa]|uniref:ABC transporter substrate-binding protein n=1 Tax=Amycolatopsis granulosa TaxID=185684 RepID=UPI001ABB9297|nr:iron-siderophore ABC transporter substrate-binding protein [Amycolatopsis granulosa]NIH85981.1 iron complex transport system substrate-binding protein [Amycolatopsis granulosa]